MKLVFVLFPFLAFGQAQTYITFTFDPPGSVYTTVNGINNAGQIVGSYRDSAGADHNFIRAADGVTYTSIDVPGSIRGTTTTDGINNLGQVVGTYQDANGIRGYIRSADGQMYTTLEPDLGPRAINDRGDIVGEIVPSGAPEAFVRTADGRVTIVKVPGWTYATAINNNGEVAGWSVIGGSYGVIRAFLLHPDGSTDDIYVPGVNSRDGVALDSINNHGQIVGNTTDGHSFIRNADGTFASFDLSGAVAINDLGVAAGSSFGPTDNRYHGIVAVPSGISTAPAIRKWAGVLSASGFGGAAAISPGTWIEIYGQNLAPTTRQWRLSDFTGNVAPTSLDGVTVRINGRPAYISYISPMQINALVPADIAPGPAMVVVGDSAAYTITAIALTPGLFVSPLVSANRRQVMAYFQDGTLVGPDHRAKPGDYLTLYGIGFGPVSPDVPVGQIAQQASRLQSDVEVKFGGVLAKVDYAGVVPGSVGAYQFNVIVPNVFVTPSDNVEVTMTVNGVTLPIASGPQQYYTSVGQ